MNFLLLFPFPVLTKRGGLYAFFDSWRESYYIPKYGYDYDECDFDCDDEDDMSEFTDRVSARRQCEFKEEKCRSERSNPSLLIIGIFVFMLMNSFVIIILCYMRYEQPRIVVRSQHKVNAG